MLHLFLSKYRETLIDRCLIKVARRSGGHTAHALSSAGVPLFLDQLILTLKLEQSSGAHGGDRVSGPAGGPSSGSNLGKAATQHGRELSERGFTLEQVVHDYGDLCQAIMDVSLELAVPIHLEEFRTLNRCLDNAIADAVTEFSEQRQLISDDREQQLLNHRFATLASDLRTHINAASFSYAAIKSGQASVGGATSTVLERSLKSLRQIVDQTVLEALIPPAMPINHDIVQIDDLLGDVKRAVTGDAKASRCKFALHVVGLGLAVRVDRDLISAAIANLLHNAFKFTRAGGAVTLTAYEAGGQLLIDVQDQCGGLGHVHKEDLFQPFKQSDRIKPGTGVGLGLSVARRSVEAHSGTLTVRDLPGSGCVFTISLPRCADDDAGANQLPGLGSVAQGAAN